MKNLAYIIEDNDDISYFFSRALATVGFQTEIISNGKVAILRTRKRKSVPCYPRYARSRGKWRRYSYLHPS